MYEGDPRFEKFTMQKWGLPTVFEVDSWNIQQIPHLGFTETSQTFSSFSQPFFHSFQGGENCQYYRLVFELFSFVPPLETMIKKSCLKELKFCEVPENPTSSICWKFQLSISKTVGCPHFCIVNIPNRGSTFSSNLRSMKYYYILF